MADISGHILQHKWQNIPTIQLHSRGSHPLRTLELTADKITEAFFDLQFNFQIIHCYYFCGDHFLKYIRLFAVITKFPFVIFLIFIFHTCIPKIEWF